MGMEEAKFMRGGRVGTTSVASAMLGGLLHNLFFRVLLPFPYPFCCLSPRRSLLGSVASDTHALSSVAHAQALVWINLHSRNSSVEAQLMV